MLLLFCTTRYSSVESNMQIGLLQATNGAICGSIIPAISRVFLLHHCFCYFCCCHAVLHVFPSLFCNSCVIVFLCDFSEYVCSSYSPHAIQGSGPPLRVPTFSCRTRILAWKFDARPKTAIFVSLWLPKSINECSFSPQIFLFFVVFLGDHGWDSP